MCLNSFQTFPGTSFFCFQCENKNFCLYLLLINLVQSAFPTSNKSARLLQWQVFFPGLTLNGPCLVGAFLEHGVVVRAFGLYWGGIRFESLSNHHCWSLSKSFIPSSVVWSMTKNNAFGGEKQKQKKSNGEQSGLCDLEQVTLKPQLQVHHYLTTWLQILYHSLLFGDSIRKGTDLEKQNCLFGVHPAVMGKLTSLFS